MTPTYLPKKFANRFQVVENNTLEQICQTHKSEWASKIAELLNEEESAKATNVKTTLPLYTAVG